MTQQSSLSNVCSLPLCLSPASFGLFIKFIAPHSVAVACLLLQPNQRGIRNQQYNSNNKKKGKTKHKLLNWIVGLGREGGMVFSIVSDCRTDRIIAWPQYGINSVSSLLCAPMYVPLCVPSVPVFTLGANSINCIALTVCKVSALWIFNVHSMDDLL